MTEREIMEKIEQSAGHVPIPEALTPEEVRRRLEREKGAVGDKAVTEIRGPEREKGAEGECAVLEIRGPERERAVVNGKHVASENQRPEQEKSAVGERSAFRSEYTEIGKGGDRMGENRKKEQEGKMQWYRRYAGRSAAAAAIAVLLLAGAAGAYVSQRGGFGSPMETAEHEGGGQDAAATGQNASGEQDKEQPPGAAGQTASGEQVAAAYGPKRDAGDLYTTAADYGEVYDAIEEMRWKVYEESKLESGATADRGEMADSGTAGMRDINYSADEMNSAAAPMDAAGESAVKEASDEAYSRTNLQTEGVDESDIIKTDGSYLYIVKNEGVVILDVRAKEMKQAGEITFTAGSTADSVREMYVDNDTLNLVIEREESELKKENAVPGEDEAEKKTADIYSLDTNLSTELWTYDISDRTNPVLKGKMTQDGAYSTSRKIGDIVYLFTQEGVQRPAVAREEAVAEDKVGGWIPLVNGKAVAADCIYIPELGNQSLLVTSVDIRQPEQVVDNTLIINRSVEIYVSTGALYLYGQDYSGSGVTTQIAKFQLDKGVIDAVGAVSVAGAVTDTFAVNEYQGKLRVLTTDWSGAENQNFLYLFDEELKRTGSLGEIAPGEEIYAARYLGNTAYFVTYRNTDPLFAVDLSDESNPKILSELKITGFSEYLHFWGEDQLLGIGYETDPDSGSRKGIKLTMFDISDPADLKTAGTSVIKNLDYSPALYDYKCVLADAKENIIGFAGESYREREQYSYLVFSWEDGAFREQMTESLGDGADLSAYRGIFIGDRFYLASPENVVSYDRKDGYKVLQKMEL